MNVPLPEERGHSKYVYPCQSSRQVPNDRSVWIACESTRRQQEPVVTENYNSLRSEIVEHRYTRANACPGDMQDLRARTTHRPPLKRKKHPTGGVNAAGDRLLSAGGLHKTGVAAR